MKKWKIVSFFSLIIFLASFAIFLAPSLNRVYASKENIEPQILETQDLIEYETEGRNFGVLPRTKRQTLGLNTSLPNKAGSVNASNLPTSYSIADEIDIEVKNQQQYGLCYSFAALSALEITMAKSLGVYYDFSEIYIPYAQAINQGEESLSMLGGNFVDVIEVATLYGLALESEMPYPTFTNGIVSNDYGTGTKQNQSADGSSYYYLYSNFSTSLKESVKGISRTIDLTNSGFDFPDTDASGTRRAAIKNHIYTYGAVYAEYFVATENYSSYLTNEVYKYTGSNGINHAITLIGWDDSKQAYIALNSWGTDWIYGNNGLFYISYDDKHVENLCSGFLPEGIKFDHQHEMGGLMNDGTINAYSAFTSGIRDSITTISNTTGKTIYVDEITIPLTALGDTISIDYKKVSKTADISIISVNSTFKSLVSNKVINNSYISQMGGIYAARNSYSSGYYTFKLDTPLELSTTSAIAVRITSGKGAALIDLYSKNSITNSTTYFYDGSTYQTYIAMYPTSSYEGHTNILIGYRGNNNSHDFSVGKLNDAITSNYIDYFDNDGGAVYIPLGINADESSIANFDVSINKLERLSKTALTSGFEVKHSAVNPDFDSDGNSTLDMQNIYVEFDSKPANGSYVITVGYGDESINKYFKIVSTTSVKQCYDITYETSGALSVTHENPTKYYAGWQNVVIHNAESSVSEFGGWKDSGNNLTTTLQTTGGDIELTAVWESSDAELSVSLNDIDNFTYDGTIRTLTATITNTFSETQYSSQIVEWFKDGSSSVYSTAESLNIKNVSDSGTYKCVVTIKDSGGVVITSSEATTSIQVSKATITVFPIKNVTKKSGESDPVIEYSYSGNISGEEPVFTGALSREAGSAGGVYAITIGDLAISNNGSFITNNYNLVFSNPNNYQFYIGALTVSVSEEKSKDIYDGTALIIEVLSSSNTYQLGSFEEEYYLWYKVSSGGAETLVARFSTLDEAKLSLKNVEDSSKYRCYYRIYGKNGVLIDSVFAETNIAIGQRNLIVSASASASKGYGEADPEFSYTWTGQVAGEVPGFSGKLSRGAGEDRGTYLISQGNLALIDLDEFKASNYTMSFSNTDGFSLTIEKATLILKVVSDACEGNQTKTYGDDDPITTLEVVSGLRAGETARFNKGPSRFETRAVGVYDYNLEGVALIPGVGYANPENYTLELEPATLTITKRTLTLQLFVRSNEGDFEYLETLDYSGNIDTNVYVKAGNIVNNTEGYPDGVTLTYSESSVLSASNAGEYTVVVESVNNPNYVLPENKTFTWAIRKINPFVPELSLRAIYGDTVLSVQLEEGFVWSSEYDETVRVGDVGTQSFMATYTHSDTTNYNSVEVELDIVVSPKSLTITPKANQFKIYDGFGGINSTLEFDILESDLVGGEVAKTKGALTRDDIENKNVGSYRILIGTLELEDNGNFKKSNYRINFVENKIFNINRREIVLSFAGYENLYFDGTEKEIEVLFENKVDGDDVSITFKNDSLNAASTNQIRNANGNIYATNQGLYRISIDYLSGNDSGNYSANINLNFEFSIGIATIIVTPVQNQGHIYGEDEQVIQYTYSGNVAGQTPAFDGELLRKEVGKKSVGSYPIQIGTLVLKDNLETGFMAENYNLKLSDTVVNYIITARTITLKKVDSAPAITKIFDGNNSYNSLDNIIFGTHFVADEDCILESDVADINITIGSASFDSSFVGENNFIKIRGFNLLTSSKNYILDTTYLEVNGHINPKVLTASVVVLDKEYDGNDKINLEFENLDGFAGKYEVSLATVETVATLSSSAVGTYNYLNGQIQFEIPNLIDRSGNNFERNYTLSINDFSVSIIKKQISNSMISWVRGTKDSFELIENNPFIYNSENQGNSILAYYLDVDGTTKIWLDLEIANGDVFRAVGNYIVNVSNSNSNYELKADVTSKKLSISPKELTIKLENSELSKVYDGTNEISITYLGLDGILNSEAVSLKVNPTKVISSSADIGKYSILDGNLTFDVELELKGSYASNYKLVSSNISFEIEQKVVAVSDITWAFENNAIAIQNNKIELDYNGMNQLNQLTAKFVANGTTYNLTLQIIEGEELLKNAGTYQVQAVSNEGENVGISSANPVVLTIEVAKKDLYINLMTENKIYDGNTAVSISNHNIIGTATNDEISLNIDELVLTTESKNVGENLPVIVNGNASQINGILPLVVVGEGTTLNNYNLYVEIPAISIGQREVRASWHGSQLIYNGSAQIPTCTIDGVLFGDECKGIYDGYTREVTTMPHTANIRGLSNANYKLLEDNTSISFTIIPATIKIKTTDLSVPEGSDIPYAYEVIEGTLYEGDVLNVTYELRAVEGEEYKHIITADAYNKNYIIEYEFGTLTELPVNRTFVIVVFGFIVLFFVVEIVILRVKAIKKAKSKPTLKNIEGEKDGNND